MGDADPSPGSFRIHEHPILSPVHRDEIRFTFNGSPLLAHKGEMISTALFANGIRIFGTHHDDGFPQGIFCANGQCAQCLVLADGLAVKACITELKPGMHVKSLEGLPELPALETPPAGDQAVRGSDDHAGHGSEKPYEEIPGSMDSSKILTQTIIDPMPPEYEIDVFIMGAGPAGLSAALELGKMGVNVILADDKHELGGKLSLQTHNFFGSVRECNAGIRGMDIGTLLSQQFSELETVDVWLNSPVVGVFSDKKIGVVKDGRYVLVRPDRFLVAAGAREKALAFPGCDLPGVYGAGAFQTLVNRDMVRAAERLFVVGGGNVGLIAAYHALQAGIHVLGIVEALQECGGYKVHLDKIKRLGVPVWTRHTVLRAEGEGKLERVIISEIDDRFRPIPGTEAEFEVDTLLIAVGLSPVNEMAGKAREFGIHTYTAGDSDMIAEASAAMFSGRIEGRRILRDMGFDAISPPEWNDMVEILRSKPGTCQPLVPQDVGSNRIFPIIRCVQEIPCNPCSEVCRMQSLTIESDSIMTTPTFNPDGTCVGCGRCVSACPGLAITLVDEAYDESKQIALAIIPWELPSGNLTIGNKYPTSGFEGELLGIGKVIAIKESDWQDRRHLVYLEVPFYEARLVAGIRIIDPVDKARPLSVKAVEDDEIIVCRCERVTKARIKEKILEGCRDFNSLKAELRTGMGPCGGKTCLELIWRIFRECGVEPREVEPNVYRPLELEVPLSAFLGSGGGSGGCSEQMMPSCGEASLTHDADSMDPSEVEP